jgi:sulfotransferase
MTEDSMKPQTKIVPYQDELHGEAVEDILTGEYGYRYRVLDGVIMPPYITPSRYQLSRELEMRAGDICFDSFPKSGSTWLSNIILLITTAGEDPADKPLRDCVHWVASSWPYPREKEEIDALPSPRIFKSHMPYRMAPGGDPRNNPCKYVYIARNPKDVAVSYYHFESGKNWSGNYTGPWEHWLKIFLEGRVQRGDWFDHVLSWWEQKDADNILFLRYEDLKRNFDQELQKIAAFLGYPLTGEITNKIKHKTSFNHMKKDSFSNLQEISQLEGFYRKGQIGSWKDQFTVAQNEYFEKIYAERMKNTGLDFVFEA